MTDDTYEKWSRGKLFHYREIIFLISQDDRWPGCLTGHNALTEPKGVCISDQVPESTWQCGSCSFHTHIWAYSSLRNGWGHIGYKGRGPIQRV